MSEVNAVVVETKIVDTQKSEGANTPEPSMAEYAARREAELRGEKIEPAAAVETKEPAAATDDTAATTDETTDEGKTTTESAPEEPVLEETHPAKKGINKRFGELTAEREKAKTEAAEAKASAAAAEAKATEAIAELQRMKDEAAKAAEIIVPVVAEAKDDPLPQRDAFDDPDEYVAALSAYTTRAEIRKSNEAAQAIVEARKSEIAKATEEARQAKVQEQITTLHKNFNERVEKAQTDYSDYAEKVTNNEKLTLRNDIFFTIEQAEMAPHILYHLANNPETAASLNQMQPIDAAIKLGEIQAEIRIARRPKPSKAAEPIKPVGNRASPESKTPNEESMEEYAARRDREEQAKRQAKVKRAANR